MVAIRLKRTSRYTIVALMVFALLGSLYFRQAFVCEQCERTIHSYRQNYVRQTEEFGRNAMQVAKIDPQVENTSDLKKFVFLHNRQQPIQNEGLLTAFDRSTSGVVFLVQVHTRFDELQLVVESLREVKFIESCLLIFSHDVINKTMNEYIANITFAPVLQIFFPFSNQLHPKEFPDQSPNDCSRDEGKASAKQRGCANADFPDTYGHYREAHITQMKHHYLWMLHFAFEKVKVLENFLGTIVQLDDDIYVYKDVVFLLQKASKEIQGHEFQNVSLIFLGTSMVGNSADKSLRLLKMDWRPGSWGFGLRRHFWTQLRSCVRTFCNVDDYNWDWSLLHTAAKCFPEGRLKMLRFSVGRVYHMGICRGTHVHHLSRNDNGMCTLTGIRRDVERSLEGYELFPNTITIEEGPTQSASLPQPFGGWNDPRDQMLCRNLLRDSEEVDLKTIQSVLQQ